MQVEGARDDQPKLVDVDRFLVEVISAHRDCAGGAFARAVAGRHDDFRVGLEPQDFRERREAFLRPVRVRRQAQVQSDDCRFMRAQRVDGFCPAARADDFIPVIGPFQLPLETLVVFHDEQHFENFAHAIFRSGWCSGSAAGSEMVKVVPWPGRLSTLI
jgi:hypothetical protein